MTVAEPAGFGGSSSSPFRRLAAISSKLLGLPLLLALGLGVMLTQSESRFRALSKGLDADEAALHRFRWEPPALRRAGEAGNAAEAMYEVLAKLPALAAPEREAVAKLLHFGGPVDAALKARFAERGPALAQLRAASRRSFAMTTLSAGQGDGMHGPDYVRVLDAVMLMLSQAEAAGANEALEVSTDAIRIGQLLIPGGPLEAASVASRISALAARVIGRQATHATPAALINAAKELHLLAKNPAPTGVGLELADIQAAARVREAAARKSGTPWGAVSARKELFAAWAVYDAPERWRELDPADYPAAVATWRGEGERRASSELPFVADASRGVTGFLFDDMRGQALVRCLAVGVATLSDRARTGKLPREPLGFKDPTLRDPFSGRNLNWRVTQDGTDLAVWSVGENMRDDFGTDEWSGQAPLDVTVHFTLAVAEELTAAAERGRRRRPTPP